MSTSACSEIAVVNVIVTNYYCLIITIWFNRSDFVKGDIDFIIYIIYNVAVRIIFRMDWTKFINLNDTKKISGTNEDLFRFNWYIYFIYSE